VMMYVNTAILVLFFLSLSSYTVGYTGNWALSFDGVSSIVKSGHMYTDLNLADTWTLEAWIKPYGNQGTMFQPNIVGFPSRHPQLELCGQTPHVGCPGNPTKTLTQLRDRNGNYFTMIGTNPLAETTNTWYHIAASWNNQTFTTYINGNQDVQNMPYQMGYIEPLNCSSTFCDEGIDIGGYRFIDQGGPYTNQYFKGLIDEVRVWTKGRTADDIKKYMSTTLSGNEDGLLYYWRFDEGQGLLIQSTAFPSFGTLGGGIVSAEPRWVQSDAPITNPYPAPIPAGCPTAAPVACNVNQEGVYVAGSILGIVFILVGIVIGYVGVKRMGNYQPLK